MDNRDFIKSFEHSLKSHSVNRRVFLYERNETCSSNIKNFTAKDVILNLSQQVQALQRADNVKTVVNKKDLSVYKQHNFIPVNVLTNNQIKETQFTKFESQCVTDTQLVKVTEHAEATISIQNTRQNMFVYKNSFAANTNKKTENLDLDTRIEKCMEDRELRNKSEEEITLSQSIPLSLDTCSPSKFNDNNETQPNSIDVDWNVKLESPKSPILRQSFSPVIKSNTPSPLVFCLKTFENFESIAMPVVTENHDIVIAKQLIKSQIASKEYTEPFICNKERPSSPVLRIKKKSTDNKNNNIRTVKKIGIITIEDNILFSSDEENEFEDSEEIPLTCSLTTSFHDEHGLDESMFVGFQTASNKSIQICSDSFLKAKAMLNDINKDFPLTKAIESHSVENPNNIKETDRDNKISENNSILIFNEHHSMDERNEETLTKNKTVLSVAHFACNKENERSEFRIERNKIKPCILTSCDEKEIESKHNDFCLKETYDKSDTIRLQSKQINTEIEEFNIDDNIIKEFENNFLVENEDINNKNNVEMKSTFGLELSQHCCQNIGQNFEGFKTANNKEIKINANAMAKVKNIFEDIDLKDVTHNMVLDNFKEITEYNIHQPSTSKGFVGFKTASNKSIDISDQALAKSKTLFNDIENEVKLKVVDENLQSKRNFETDFKNPYLNENERNVDFSELTTKTHQNLNELLVNKSAVTNITNSSKYTGFQTASNKPVAISKEGLDKTKKIFQDIEDNFENTYKPFSENNHSNHFIGFQTANNKPIRISEDALRKSRKLFDDINEHNTSALSPEYSYNNMPNKDKVNKFEIAPNKNILEKNNCHGTNNICNDKILLNDKKSDSKYMEKNSGFGFQTASNKPVTISNEALAKTKHIFQDIDKNIEKEDRIEIPNKVKSAFEGFKTASAKPVSISKSAILKTKELFKDIYDDDKLGATSKLTAFSGFQTASNRRVEISEDALLKSKKMFEDMNLKNDKSMEEMNFINHKEEKMCTELSIVKANMDDKATNDDNNMDIENLINEDVVKDLEETLYTEDFYKEKTPKSKRSGSPILSCPKAKKRKKFETPKIIKPTIITGKTDNKKTYRTYDFDEGYKKCKIFNLKNLIEMEKSIARNTQFDPYISTFDFDTLLNFEFSGKRNDIDNDTWNVDIIKKVFTDSVNKKIIPEGWLENHFKLIVWKLLSYEIVFPNVMENLCTVKNLLHQLKYRYDRELYNVERPALRKILEKDEISSKTMVLSVVAIHADGVCINSAANTNQNLEFILTDGWYTIKALIDNMINKLICDGKIIVGTKLVIHGAELFNCEQGIAPWENTSSVRLKIFGNSIRRAKWDTRLGFHGNGAILSHLSAVTVEGGKVSRLKAFVTRVYPMLYVERLDDGSTVTRSERLESLYQITHDNERQKQLEELYEEVQKQSDNESQDSESAETERDIDSGTQLCKLMKKCRDPAEFRSGLTNSQINLLQEHTSKKREKLIENMQRKIIGLVKQRGLDVNRNVVPLLKIRVADVCTQGNVTGAMVTIWRPNESLLDLIKEGTWIEIFNVVPTCYRYSEIQISAGRQSVFKKSKLKQSDRLTSITQPLIRKPLHIKDLINITADKEIDTYGFIFLIDPSNNIYENTTKMFQNVYMADEHKNVICINFWGGIKKFGFQSILDTGQIVSCVNLHTRHGNTKTCLPQYRATEFTYFTKSCKIDILRIITEDLTKKFSSLDKRKFIEECIEIKNRLAHSKHGNTEKCSPYRLNNSEYNMTKNKQFIDSPVANRDDNLNLTGLDFDSTFKQTNTQELSPKTLLRKRRVNEKIAKLETYGEPPPLRPIHIINKSNIINNSYKSPVLTKSDSITNNTNQSVTSANKHTDIVLNRTYVKNINPVKLTFSNNDSEDPFAEEFDVSPPMSFE